MKTNHERCRFCGEQPPMIFVREYERKKLEENGRPEWMGEVQTVRVYQCPNCQKMFLVTVKK